MRTTTKFLALAGLVIGIGGEATAQSPRGAVASRPPQGGALGAALASRGPGAVTAMLNARRQLDLSPRQVAQLDSIERGLHAERQRVAARARPAMDSLRQRVVAATAGADRILNDTQRSKWREMQAERRGFARGMRQDRGRQQGMQGRQPNRGAPQMRRPQGGQRGGQQTPGRRP